MASSGNLHHSNIQTTSAGSKAYHFTIALVLALTFLSSLLVLSPFAESAEILKVKGKKVQIQLDDENFRVGDTVYAKRGRKKVAVIKIGKRRGDKAYGFIKKGKVRRGMVVVAKKGKSKKKYRKKKRKKRYSRKSRSRRSRKSKKPLSFGLLLGYGMDAMTVELSSTTAKETLTQTGSGINAKIFGDYNLLPYLGIRGQVGMTTFKVTGTSTESLCGDDGIKDCYTEATYIAFDVWARYAFINKASKYWIGAGFGYMTPSSSDTTALAADSIQSTSLFMFGGGADIAVAHDMFIPVSIDYAMFPNSAQVSASIININGGFGIRF